MPPYGTVSLAGQNELHAEKDAGHREGFAVQARIGQHDHATLGTLPGPQVTCPQNEWAECIV